MADDIADAWATAIRRGSTAKTEIDPTHPLRLLYGMDDDSRPLFFTISAVQPPLPEISEDVLVTRGHRPDNTWTLALTLRDPSLFDVFATLCLDLVQKSRDAPTEDAAMQLLLEGLTRWKDLLRPARSRHLTHEALRGLVGELWFAFTHLTRTASPDKVLAAWKGPLGSPQDIDFGPLLYEVKAVRPGAVDIHISSAQQLDALHRDLRLVVVTLEDADPATPEAVTLPRLTDRILDQLTPAGNARIRFADLLAAYPVDPRDPWYHDRAFRTIGFREYQVTEQFPAIRASRLSAGIRDVRYRLDTVTLTPFIRDQSPD